VIPLAVVGFGVWVVDILLWAGSSNIAGSVICLHTINMVNLVLSFLWLWKERLCHKLVNPECFAFAIIINQRDFQVSRLG